MPMKSNGILVGVDGSPESDAAVRWAAQEAVMRRAALTLTSVIVPVVVPWPVRYLEADYRQQQEAHAKEVITLAEEIARQAAEHSELPIKTEVRHGNAVVELIKASKTATMIVIGSRGLGAFGAGLLGSVSRGLLHYARSPVAVIHGEPETDARTRPVLLGIDGSPASEAAAEFAFDEASHRGVDVIALHAWSDVSPEPAMGQDWREYQEEAGEILTQQLSGFQERYPDVRVRRRVVCDRPAKWLIEESTHVQLIVLGNRGRGGFTRLLLGSVSTAVAESSTAPVIVVPSDTAAHQSN